MTYELTKEKLSASTDGMGINITQTSTAGTLLHTASAVAGVLDELRLWVVNISASSVKLTVEYGGATATDNIEVTIPGESGLWEVIPGLILANSKTLRAFAATTAVLTAHGFVNRYTPT
jgi:hypothetical protein